MEKIVKIFYINYKRAKMNILGFYNTKFYFEIFICFKINIFCNYLTFDHDVTLKMKFF